MRKSVEQWYDQFVFTHFSNESTAEFTLFAIAFIGLYWLHGLAYLFLDTLKRPQFLLRFKIQPTSQISSTKLLKLIKQVLLNQALTLPVAYIVFHYRHRSRVVPTFSRFLGELLFFLLLVEVLFYYLHRALHHPWVYRLAHKVHHDWQTSIALEAMYAHPLEHLLLNFLIELVGPLYFHSHSLTLVFWFAFVVILNQVDHSGYDFPLNPFPPVFHDFHHLK